MGMVTIGSDAIDPAASPRAYLMAIARNPKLVADLLGEAA